MSVNRRTISSYRKGLSLGSKQVRPILENTAPSNSEEKKSKPLHTQQGIIECKRNGYRNQSPGLQKQPSHPLYKDIKNEYIHVCKLTNASNSLVKPQEGKVLVLQLLQRPRCRAGVSVTVERDGVKKQQEAEPRKQKAPSTIIRPNVTPLYGDWWYIIKVSADNEMSNVAKSWAVSGISAVVVHAVWTLSTQTPVFLERF